jgi:hypothetical protein
MRSAVTELIRGANPGTDGTVPIFLHPEWLRSSVLESPVETGRSPLTFFLNSAYQLR